MANYDFQAIEKKWQARWKTDHVFANEPADNRPHFYILDMFPYPSGAGLHVGHPLGYIATDIYARYMRLKGYRVLHPMGFDAFGLPAENYAIQTGQHPAKTTEINIARYKAQLEMIGLFYTEDTDFRTCDPAYYRWTQWIFTKFFSSWYNLATQRAEPIDTLITLFEQSGNTTVQAANHCDITFSAAEWQAFSKHQKADVLMQYRLAYTANTFVNWCPELGTVLANEEVKDGVSERGGYPVERKLMRQWQLRITAYADRLFDDLDTVNWPVSVVEMQRNWIGRSYGGSVNFCVNDKPVTIEVFTTRPDTIFGVTFLVLAPEHPIVPLITNETQRAAVEQYISETAIRTERDRLADIKRVSGVFTGATVNHPYTNEALPVWISDYVLAGYGTGAIMAVPASDSRDFAFAKHFNLPIIPVIEGTNLEKGAYEAKTGVMINSDFLNGLTVEQAIETALADFEKRGLGKKRTSYRLRDAIFSRQRYWGEPFPIVYRDGIAEALPDSALPVTLPDVQSYKPTGTGESPLAAITSWVNLPDGTVRETDTMPGWAGSSWYFFRYLDPKNNQMFADPQAIKDRLPVDLYMGGSEHAVGHLLYARFWTKFLFDLGYSPVSEPFNRLINQGMIQGRSALAYKRKDENTFVSFNKIDPNQTYIKIHVDINLVQEDHLDVNAFKQNWPDYADATFILDDNGAFICGTEIEKMSKTFYNVVNPDAICQQYGADAFRLYEMFLGPIDQHKPWHTNGISGTASFLRRVFNLYFDDQQRLSLTDEPPSPEELKLLHITIKKFEEDIENLSFNTTVSQLMIFVNEMQRLKCRKRAILEPFVKLLAPYAPHIAEEIWEALGNAKSILYSTFPVFNPVYLVEDTFEYPISINGKLRAKLNLPLDYSTDQVTEAVLQLEAVQKHLSNKAIKKIIVVPGKIVNLVV